MPSSLPRCRTPAMKHSTANNCTIQLMTHRPKPGPKEYVPVVWRIVNDFCGVEKKGYSAKSRKRQGIGYAHTGTWRAALMRGGAAITVAAVHRQRGSHSETNKEAHDLPCQHPDSSASYEPAVTRTHSCRSCPSQMRMQNKPWQGSAPDPDQRHGTRSRPRVRRHQR